MGDSIGELFGIFHFENRSFAYGNNEEQKKYRPALLFHARAFALRGNFRMGYGGA